MEYTNDNIVSHVYWYILLLFIILYTEMEETMEQTDCQQELLNALKSGKEIIVRFRDLQDTICHYSCNPDGSVEFKALNDFGWFSLDDYDSYHIHMENNSLTLCLQMDTPD